MVREATSKASLSAILASFILASSCALRVLSSLRPWICSLNSALCVRNFWNSRSRSFSFAVVYQVKSVLDLYCYRRFIQQEVKEQNCRDFMYLCAVSLSAHTLHLSTCAYYMYTCVRVCTCMCMCVSVCMFACVSTCVYVCVCICMYVCMCVCMCVRLLSSHLVPPSRPVSV